MHAATVSSAFPATTTAADLPVFARLNGLNTIARLWMNKFVLDWQVRALKKFLFLDGLSRLNSNSNVVLVETTAFLCRLPFVVRSLLTIALLASSTRLASTIALPKLPDDVLFGVLVFIVTERGCGGLVLAWLWPVLMLDSVKLAEPLRKLNLRTNNNPHVKRFALPLLPSVACACLSG
jgi:hypothetical protein